MNAQLLSRRGIQLSTSCFPSLDNSLGNTKRYAMYIPQSFFENAREALAQVETESTWEFSALISPSESISLESTSNLLSTPAKEIAIRYRAGMPLCFDSDEPQSNIPIDIGASTDDGSSATFYSSVEFPECLSDDTLMVCITQSEIKFPHGQSCLGLSETLVSRSSADSGTLPHSILTSFINLGEGSSSSYQNAWLSRGKLQGLSES
jgi:hypothetical protein